MWLQGGLSKGGRLGALTQHNHLWKLNAIMLCAGERLSYINRFLFSDFALRESLKLRKASPKCGAKSASSGSVFICQLQSARHRMRYRLNKSILCLGCSFTPAGLICSCLRYYSWSKASEKLNLFTLSGRSGSQWRSSKLFIYQSAEHSVEELSFVFELWVYVVGLASDHCCESVFVWEFSHQTAFCGSSMLAKTWRAKQKYVRQETKTSVQDKTNLGGTDFPTHCARCCCHPAFPSFPPCWWKHHHELGLQERRRGAREMGDC